ncbi:aminotransferase class V-fold PLP-dependent enzyme [Robiginitalea sp. SC105]|uniref:aminotransferase class V-fold PLP-dependent enzyme n=1 Tax=Robiginitalea sp. SC105 TaxID=2762332 RepID=UPI00163A9300|nr:aminotransferase class V-fold PLP-dependent enzyme [Robiginitalea sp. SC105]MBC2838912.1 aminotransferase class V-fold PLP-dependent enzyme [Robiginitalea sp. SC105]
MSSFQHFRDQFPALKRYTYLNTAAWGLMHEEVLNWRQEHDLDFLIGGSVHKMKSLEILDQTRDRVGHCFNCPPDRVALTPNFSIGLNLLLEGLEAGSRILLLEGDYPSLNWPFRSRDFRVQMVEPGASPEARILEALRTNPADVLALSLVQWIDGLLIEPTFLASLKTEFPDLLIVADGTQYVGAFQLDLPGSGIDVLGASGYKWLLGGNGNGFLCFSEQGMRRFRPPSTGFNASGHDLSGREAVGLPRSLEPGHLDLVNFGSLHRSLELLGELGMGAIDTRSREMSGLVARALREAGLGTEALERPRHSTIFNIPGADDSLMERLRAADVVCSRRGGGIRVSFHCYNTENDLEKLLDLLK